MLGIGIVLDRFSWLGMRIMGKLLLRSFRFWFYFLLSCF